jgi:hypothetical protein
MNSRLTALLLAVAACNTDARDAPPAPTTRASSGTPPPPVDHLAPGELVEGKDALIGLKVPRDLAVRMTTPARGVAEGAVQPERVSNFVRARVQGGKMSVGATGTVFEGVHARTTPDRPLRVLISTSQGLCRMEVWDMTPPPPAPDPGSDAERWRRAGFSPDGKLLDPAHTQ